MKKFLIAFIILASPLAANKNCVYESGWWTGPLFASHARVFPKGDLIVEPYFFYYASQGRYNNSWELKDTTRFFTVNPLLFLDYGLTDRLDIELQGSWFFNSTGGQHGQGYGDTTVGIDYEITKDDYSTYSFDLLYVLREIFPTGRYNNLNPKLLGADASGRGAYITQTGFNFQKVFLMDNGRLFRLRGNALYDIPAWTHVNGFNYFGGGIGTKGRVFIGNIWYFTLAYELQLTQNWVFACDYLFTIGAGSKFRGTHGTLDGIITASTGYPSWASISVAPAIEYNFNAYCGLIAGVWVSLAGRNYPAFISPIVALNLIF